MQQLDIRGIGPARRPTNQGFVASYEEKGRGIAAPAFEGLLGPIANWWFRRQAGKRVVENRGPVLATLAQEFGVCSKWFASVPGETWPNRNYLHAATSDGTTNIVLRFYSDPTIFELLEERGKQWHVYHDDTPQIWAFKKLWEGDRRRNWFVFGEFAKHVREGRLPHYSFIEPNHRPPVHVSPSGGEPGNQEPPPPRHRRRARARARQVTAAFAEAADEARRRG